MTFNLIRWFLVALLLGSSLAPAATVRLETSAARTEVIFGPERPLEPIRHYPLGGSAWVVELPADAFGPLPDTQGLSSEELSRLQLLGSDVLGGDRVRVVLTLREGAVLSDVELRGRELVLSLMDRAEADRLEEQRLRKAEEVREAVQREEAHLEVDKQKALREVREQAARERERTLREEERRLEEERRRALRELEERERERMEREATAMRAATDEEVAQRRRRYLAGLEEDLQETLEAERAKAGERRAAALEELRRREQAATDQALARARTELASEREERLEQERREIRQSMSQDLEREAERIRAEMRQEMREEMQRQREEILRDLESREQAATQRALEEAQHEADRRREEALRRFWEEADRELEKALEEARRQSSMRLEETLEQFRREAPPAPVPQSASAREVPDRPSPATADALEEAESEGTDGDQAKALRARKELIEEQSRERERRWELRRRWVEAGIEADRQVALQSGRLPEDPVEVPDLSDKGIPSLLDPGRRRRREYAARMARPVPEPSRPDIAASPPSSHVPATARPARPGGADGGSAVRAGGAQEGDSEIAGTTSIEVTPDQREAARAAAVARSLSGEDEDREATDTLLAFTMPPGSEEETGERPIPPTNRAGSEDRDALASQGDSEEEAIDEPAIADEGDEERAEAILEELLGRPRGRAEARLRRQEEALVRAERARMHREAENRRKSEAAEATASKGGDVLLPEVAEPSAISREEAERRLEVLERRRAAEARRTVRLPEPREHLVIADTFLRSGPSFVYPRQGAVRRGDRLVVVARMDDWLKTREGGWIFNAFLELPAP